VGAGLSADFKYKRWKPLLLDMAAGDLHATVAGLLENNQYEEAAEVWCGAYRTGSTGRFKTRSTAPDYPAST
jgi:hypothetical protein